MILPKSRKNTLFSLSLLGLCIIFYLTFALLDGPFLSPDSETYISMSLHREPLYSLWLALFRALFGPDQTVWLQWAVVGQSLLAAFAAWSIPACLCRRLSLPKKTAVILLAFPLAVSLLCRFGAGRQAMYSNGIESEAIALPLFLLFIRFLYGYILEGLSSSFPAKAALTNRNLVIAWFLSFLLISTRKQMYCTLALLLFVLLVEEVYTKQLLRFISRLFLTLLLILSLTAGLDISYNALLRGENVRHSGDSRFLLTMVYYTAKREYGQRIEDPQVQALFYDIYDACDSADYLKHSAPDGWLSRVTHFGDHYDHIQIGNLRPAVTDYVAENFSGSETDRAAEVDRIMRTMTAALLPVCLPSIIGCFFDNFLSGLVTTAALRTPVLVAFSVLLYAGYALLLLFLIKKKGRPEVIAFSVLTLVSVLINVGLVSAVIFCQSRYTIYNMPLFYMSGFLMLYEASSLLKERFSRSRLS